VTRRVPPTAAFAVLCALLALLFYREFVFAPDRVLFGTDMLDQAFQLRKFGVEEIRSGRGFPLWNPYVYGGLPYLAVLPGPVFYPTSLLYLLMPLHRAIGWTFVLHTALGGLLGYAAARSLRLGAGASALAGLAFMFTGMVVSTAYGGHDGRMFAMVLAPAAFVCVVRGLETGWPGWFAGMGVVVALQAFTPHVQVMYYASLLLVLYAALSLVATWKSGERRRALRLAGLLAAGFGIAGLVAAAQLVPTWRILEIAVRGGTGESGYGFAASWALPPQEISALALPDLVGSLGTYWGTNPFKLHTEYLGAVPLALALVGLTGLRRDGRALRLGAVALVALLFALGAATPLHRVTYHLVPFVSRFRAPSMMLGPGALYVALLAGLGWERLAAARRGEGGGEGRALPWGWLGALSAPFLLFGLAALASPAGLVRWAHTTLFPPGWDRLPGPGGLGTLRANGAFLLAGFGLTLAAARGLARRGWRPAPILFLLLALLVADLWRVDARYVTTLTTAEAFPDDPAAERLRESLGPGERVFPVPGRRTWGPNELMGSRVPSVTGSQNFRLEWYERLTGGISYRNLGVPVSWALLDVAYVAVDEPVETPLLAPFGSGARGSVYAVAEERPHAWFPSAVEATRDTAAALRRVLGLEDPESLAVVEADAAPPAGAGSARLVSSEPNEVVLELETERTGLLFVSEIWHPSWHAFVDGVEVEVLRTNVAFRGVVVPAGARELRFRYSPAEFRLGFALSALGLLLAGLLPLTGLRIRWRGAGDA
jgi:hypothetical protein